MYANTLKIEIQGVGAEAVVALQLVDGDHVRFVQLKVEKVRILGNPSFIRANASNLTFGSMQVISPICLAKLKTPE
jgi:hypothetical protein